MSGDLLQTKLHAPPLRPSFVLRPHLIKKLQEGQIGKLTLVSAPAGFGKTTLITEWLSQFANGQPITSWLSLDLGDNDPNRFLNYVVAAIQVIEPHLGETAVTFLQSPQPPPFESILTGLINEIAQITSPFILVLDDYHVINAQPIHDALNFLLDNMPSVLHLVIISRSDPPLPLSRLRVRGQMTEIRQADLCFTTDEAATFLNDVMGLSLTPEQIAILESRTEGWIAGLQLAALSMRGREDIANFIEAFSGSYRFVMDYLADETLQQQDDETRQFLYQTAILNRFNAELCNTITGQTDSQSMLTRLEQANLFIVPLDDQRKWYRYHHLFADLLRQRLVEKPQIQVKEIHRRAASWFQQNGYIADAIHHSLAANDMEQAVLLVEQNGLATLNRGEMATVNGWVQALPKEMIQNRPWLSIIRAWTSLLTAQVDGIEPSLQNGEQATMDFEENTTRHILGHVAAIRSYLSLMMGDVAKAAIQAQKALGMLPESDASTRSVVTFTLGGACLFNNDVAGACQAFAEAGKSAKLTGNIHLAVPAMCALGTLQMQCGMLHLAMKTFDEAQQMATTKGGRALPVAAGAFNGKGQIYYEWNDLETAVTHLETAVNLAEQWGNVESLISSHIYLAQVQQARGNVTVAIDLLQQAELQAAERQLSPGTASLLAAAQIRAWLARGNIRTARQLAQNRGITPNDELNYLQEAEHIALARLLFAQSQLEESQAILLGLLQAADSGGRKGRVIEILVWLAVVQKKLGEGKTAVSTLKRAVTLAEPEGYIRTFVDAGLPVQTLLTQIAKQKLAPDYIARLLSSFPDAMQSISTVASAHEEILVESISEQELKILRLMATGLSNRQIADNLFLSVNTIKWHLKNIYGKLNVNGRIEAITRAQELGLL